MPDNPFDLRRQIFDSLDLQAQIVETQGQDLDIGEKFKVRFTVTHRLFDPKTGWFEGAVRFLDCRLRLEATPYAKPTAGNPTTVCLGVLSYVGQSAEVVIEFQALARIPRLPTIPIDVPEPYVRARVSARFDIDAFLEYWKERTFSTQIQSG